MAAKKIDWRGRKLTKTAAYEVVHLYLADGYAAMKRESYVTAARSFASARDLSRVIRNNRGKDDPLVVSLCARSLRAAYPDRAVDVTNGS